MVRVERHTVYPPGMVNMRVRAPATAGPVSATLIASNDVPIWINSHSVNFNANNTLQVYDASPGGNWHSLIKFDLSSLAGRTVSAATLRLITADGYRGGTPAVIAYRILDANVWIDTQATWDTRTAGNSWAGSVGCATAGTDYDSTPICAAVSVASGDLKVIDLVMDANGIADVQSQISGINNGFLLRISGGRWTPT